MRGKGGIFGSPNAAFTHQHRGNPVYKTEKIYATGWFTAITN